MAMVAVALPMRPVFSILYVISAAAFIASLVPGPYPGSFILKAIPILLLLVASLKAEPFPGRFYLWAAILFSGAGDVILELGFSGSFILGLISFLVAHLWYIGLFCLDVSRGEVRYLATLVAIIYPAGMGVFLWPHLAELKVPVAVYISVIAAMLVSALNRRGPWGRVVTGAVFFVASDSILAMNKFYAPHPWARYGIMATYYLAQYLIVTGILMEKTGSRRTERPSA